jgi:hypothetical protein
MKICLRIKISSQCYKVTTKVRGRWLFAPETGAALLARGYLWGYILKATILIPLK